MDRLNLLKLTQKQQLLMRIWFKDARKTYNLALQYVIQQGWHLASNVQNPLFMESELIPRFVSKIGVQPKILLRTPKVIRQQAVKRVVAIKTFRTNLTKRQMLRDKYPNAKSFQPDLKSCYGITDVSALSYML